MLRKVIAFEATCERCGHVWLPLTESPIQCPRCKSPYWNIPKKAKKHGVVPTVKAAFPLQNYIVGRIRQNGEKNGASPSAAKVFPSQPLGPSRSEKIEDVKKAEDEARIEDAFQKISAEYKQMVTHLGGHPNSTLMQKSPDGKRLYRKILRRWGGLNKFKLHYGYPIAKMGNPDLKHYGQVALQRIQAKRAIERLHRKESVMQYIRLHGPIFQKSIESDLNLSYPSLKSILVELTAENKLSRIQEGIHVIYDISESRLQDGHSNKQGAINLWQH